MNVMKLSVNFFQYNSRMLIDRLYVLLIKTLPCPVFLMHIGSIVCAVRLLCKGYKKYRTLIYIKSIILPARSSAGFLLRFFLERGRERVWATVFCDNYKKLKGAFQLQQRDVLKKVLPQDKGVLLVSGHYGPVLYSFLLRMQGIAVHPVIALGKKNYIDQVKRYCVPPLLSSYIVSLYASDPIVAGQSEKKLIRCLQNKEHVLMHIDVDTRNNTPQKIKFCEDVDMYGVPMRMSLFPFKVARAYDVPIVFCFFQKQNALGYTLSLIPCQPFATPSEGLAQYITILKQHIMMNPFLWSGMASLRYCAV